MTDHKALSFNTLTRLAIEAGLMEPRDTMSSVPAEYAGSICIFAELVAAEVRAKDGVAQAPAVPAVQGDPLDWPLPCDITAGGVTIGKGCPLRTVQTRLQVQSEGAALLFKRIRELSPQAEAQAVPAWKDNDTAKLVNDLRDVAIQYHGSQQLRERISQLVRPLAAPHPSAQAPAVPAVPTYSIDDLRAARSEAYSAGVSSAVPKKVTADMRRVFREAFREGGFWADRLDYALDRMLAAAPQPSAQAPAVPAGHVLVPVEPKQKYLRPFHSCPPDELELAWSAMVTVARVSASKAPQPEADEAMRKDAELLDFICDPSRQRMVEQSGGFWRVYQDEAPLEAERYLWQSMTSRRWYPTARDAIKAALSAQGGV
jgi:hypothetical protein